ncbi:MAG: cobalamin-dependent protein [Chloroflexota bacterium]|nr:cobalamin-dependent protein [Chloroflexota bacterium]
MRESPVEESLPELLPIGQAVERLQAAYPDVSHSSLRFLEREGLVTPHRTPGGHRLFTTQDVDRVLQIKRWQEQRLSLGEIRQRLTTREANPLADLAEHLASELLRGQTTAVPALLHADDLGVPLAVLFQDILLRVQDEVGLRWQRGDLRVGQEHEITEIVREAIAQLSWRHASAPQGAPLLAACAPGEHHDLGLRMVVGLLRAQGRRVDYLGSNVDVPLLVEEIRVRLPAVILLSAKLPARFSDLQHLLEDLRRDPTTREIPVVVGGDIVQVMEEELTRLGAIPNRETDLLVAVERIVKLSEQQPVRRGSVEERTET